MIVSDAHRFVFVHIPKCGGMSVRSQIDRFHDIEQRFDGLGAHPRLGHVDLVHLPLRVLADAFPEEFAKLRRYDSFAVLRAPIERFGSSLRQTLHYYERIYPAEMDRHSLRDAVRRLIDRLEETPDWTRPDLVHFQRQVDFVSLEGTRIVKALYPIERIPDLLAAIGARTGARLDPGDRRNRDLSFRSRALVRPAYAVNAFLWRHAPERLHTSLKRIVVPLLTHRESATRRLGLAELPEVQEFVQRHYAEDAALYDAVASQRPETPREQPRAH